VGREREREVDATVRASHVTRIIIAHRPQTIRAADRVIGLDQGKVVEDFQVLSEGRYRDRPERPPNHPSGPPI
jgi:ABC-type multidrug transport system fused ATPase/permease subunit